MTTWQPVTWILFHTLALNYNEEYKDKYVTFFNTLRTIIPCRICRNHFCENIGKPGLTIDENINKDKIFNWTVDLHNCVNKMNRKKIWSYDEARNHYTKNNFNDKTLKYFIFEYIRTNFTKAPEKTIALIEMINTIPYLYPYEDKRKKLIDFKERFPLDRFNLKKWLLAFMIVLKN